MAYPLGISPVVDTAIRDHLNAIRAKHDVRILYACEAGSRAWGFESPDSDYDVRFIYAHAPSWYMSINVEHKRDVIEDASAPPLDIAGWDIRKALMLLFKGNQSLLEWLESPIIYLESDDTAKRMRDYASTWYSGEAGIYHYVSIARNNYRQYLKGSKVWLKKYLYVLRPLLAARWIEEYGEPSSFAITAPLRFDDLARAMLGDTGADCIIPCDDPPTLLAEIKMLLARKRAGDELGHGLPIPALDAFIASEMAYWETTRPKPSACDPTATRLEVLNQLFRHVVMGE